MNFALRLRSSYRCRSPVAHHLSARRTHDEVRPEVRELSEPRSVGVDDVDLRLRYEFFVGAEENPLPVGRPIRIVAATQAPRGHAARTLPPVGRDVDRLSVFRFQSAMVVTDKQETFAVRGQLRIGHVE